MAYESSITQKGRKCARKWKIEKKKSDLAWAMQWQHTGLKEKLPFRKQQLNKMHVFSIKCSISKPDFQPCFFFPSALRGLQRSTLFKGQTAWKNYHVQFKVAAKIGMVTRKPVSLQLNWQAVYDYPRELGSWVIKRLQSVERSNTTY